MTFHEAIEAAKARYTNNGQFLLLGNESINAVVKREKVPDVRGVYLIFGNDDHERPLYIGKSGTLYQDGTWSEQSLAKRLTMKQDGIYRGEYFRTLIDRERLGGLIFRWFETHGHSVKIIPALAEMELLQAYYDEYGILPRKNNQV
jgi:hypothetical protein